MNKAELIDKLAKDVKLTKTQAAQAIDCFQEAVRSTLKKRDKLTLVGFGTFKVLDRKARLGRNPQTGAEMRIPAKKVVKFLAGKKLKNKI